MTLGYAGCHDVNVDIGGCDFTKDRAQFIPVHAEEFFQWRKYCGNFSTFSKMPSIVVGSDFSGINSLSA
jgi:hypothetical protein